MSSKPSKFLLEVFGMLEEDDGSSFGIGICMYSPSTLTAMSPTWLKALNLFLWHSLRTILKYSASMFTYTLLNSLASKLDLVFVSRDKYPNLLNSFGFISDLRFPSSGKNVNNSILDEILDWCDKNCICFILITFVKLSIKC